MVRAQSRSFQRTINRWLWRSLQWWPPYHCSVPPLPPATLVRLVSDLSWNSSLLRHHQQNLHSYHCHYQPAPCAIYHSTTRAPPRSTHVPCLRPITSCTYQFLRSWVSVATRTCEDLSQHPLEYESFHYMFHSTTICSPNYLLICSCPYLYKYSSCSMYFASSKINLATYFSLPALVFLKLLLGLTPDLQNSRHPSRERCNLQVEANTSHDFGPDISIQIPSLTETLSEPSFDCSSERMWPSTDHDICEHSRALDNIFLYIWYLVYEDEFRPQKDQKRPQNWSFAVSVWFLEMPGILRTSLSLSPRLLRVKTKAGPDFQSLISWVLSVMTLTDSVFTDMISNSHWTSFKFVCLFRL